MKLRKLFPLYCLVLGIILVTTMWGNDAIALSAQEYKLPDRTVIVIDAGHGGMDGGAVSCTGVFESKINLEIALRLNDLMHFLGFETVMIRNTDKSIHTSGNSIAQKKVSDLKERVRIVNSTPCALLISIHQNMFTQSKYSGAQIFYAATDHSKELAEEMQKSFCRTINAGSSRRAKQSSGVYLMEHIHCTGVLVECGFLSNAAEEELLRTEDYQKKICCVIASSCASFITNS